MDSTFQEQAKQTAFTVYAQCINISTIPPLLLRNSREAVLSDFDLSLNQLMDNLETYQRAILCTLDDHIFFELSDSEKRTLQSNYDRIQMLLDKY